MLRCAPLATTVGPQGDAFHQTPRHLLDGATASGGHEGVDGLAVTPGIGRVGTPFRESLTGTCGGLTAAHLGAAH
jgi:hypothetical protein